MSEEKPTGGFPQKPQPTSSFNFAEQETNFAKSLEVNVPAERIDAFDKNLAEMDEYRLSNHLTETNDTIEDASPFQQEAEHAIIFPDVSVEFIEPKVPVSSDKGNYEETRERISEFQANLSLNPTGTIPVEIKKKNNGWLITSLILNAVALLGLVFWVIPVTLFALFGLVAAITALARKNQPKALGWLSLSTSLIILVVNLLILLSIIAAFAGSLSSLIPQLLNQ